jgi:hypothetical protein
MRSNGLRVNFKNPLNDYCPICKYDLLEKKKNPSCLMHNLLYINVIILFTFYVHTSQFFVKIKSTLWYQFEQSCMFPYLNYNPN